jgi:exonuclease SbcC
MRVYSEVLRLDYWEAASDRASKRLRALIGEIDDKHRQAERLMGRLEEKKAHAKEMKRLEGGWKTERRTKLKGLREEEARLDAEYKKVKRTLQRMPVPEPLDTEINEERRLEEKLKERQKAEATAEAEFNAAASELGRARIWGNALAGSVCPTCRQKVDKLHLEKERKKLVKACEETTNEAQLKFRRATAAFNVADKALADLKRALRTKRDENVKRAEALQEADRAFKQLYRNMMEAADAADECEEAVNPYSGPWMLARTEAENIASDLAKTQKAIEDQLAMQAAMEFWVRGFKDIRLFVIEEALAQLELEVNGALHQLGLEDWSIEFSIEKENKSGSIKRGLTVLVNSPMNKEPVPWEAWSGGESQRLRLAGAVGVANLILSRRGVESNVEFWDEPSTWLSEEGIKDMLAVFEQRGKQKEVWLADHRALDFGRFDKTVCVVKDESGSHIQ